MFLNPLIRKKLLQKKAYMIEQDNNPFVPSKITDDGIYLQEVEDDNVVEYKKIILKDKGKDISLIQDVDVEEDVDVDVDVCVASCALFLSSVASCWSSIRRTPPYRNQRR